MTGKALKQLRTKKLKLSQAALARQLRVGKDTVARWEQGRRSISPLAEVALEYVKITHGQTTDPGARRGGQKAAA